MRALYQAIKVLSWLNGKWTELLFLRRLYFLTIIYCFYENTFRFNFLSLESYYYKKTEFLSFWLAAINLNKPKTDKKIISKSKWLFPPAVTGGFVSIWCCVFVVLDYSRCYNEVFHFLRKCPSFQPRIIRELTDQKPRLELNWVIFGFTGSVTNPDNLLR